ncbi:MAG: iron-containing alcohol dehydrogenase [Kiritimatiellae bacterium]|nr:iron-containing alcohol dehydrogenase [Kiritimatiellia bacterium]
MRTIPAILTLPPRTLTGRDAVDHLLVECRKFGPRGMLVCGASLIRSGVRDRILAGTEGSHDISTWRHPGGEPTLDQLEQLLAAARGHGVDWIAAVGGGSVLDIAKAAAGLLEAPAPAVCYHDGESIPSSRIPFVAVPTTAGTGSEVTTVSVLTNAATGVKKSIRDPSFMARLVMLDSALITTCPSHVMAASGLDALTQAIEAYVSRNATWMTDVFALEAVRLVAQSLPCVYRGDRGSACDALLTGSSLAGLALSNARLGLVHGLAHPLGVRYHQPHGLVCAVCLPLVLAYNREAMGAKVDRLSEAMGGDVFSRVQELMRILQLVSPFGGKWIQDEDAIVRETLASGSTAANPRDVTGDDVRQILRELFAA